MAASVAIGLDVMGELFDAEATEEAGPKGKHDPSRRAYRHGCENGKVVLGGHQVPVRRPRVRVVADDDGVEHEVAWSPTTRFGAPVGAAEVRYSITSRTSPFEARIVSKSRTALDDGLDGIAS